MRWQPLVLLVAMTAGFGLMIATIDHPRRMFLPFLPGWLLFFGGFTIVNYLRLRGPRLRASATTDLDERERMVRARAGHLSGTVFTLLAIGGCFYLGVAQALALWAPHRIIEWAYLALLLEGWAFTLPVLFASWLQPRELPDEA